CSSASAHHSSSLVVSSVEASDAGVASGTGAAEVETGCECSAGCFFGSSTGTTMVPRVGMCSVAGGGFSCCPVFFVLVSDDADAQRGFPAGCGFARGSSFSESLSPGDSRCG